MTDTTNQRRWTQREPGYVVRAGEEYAYQSGDEVQSAVAEFDFVVAEGVYIATPDVPVGNLISDDPENPTLAIVTCENSRPVITEWFVDGEFLIPAEPTEGAPVSSVSSVEVVETYNPKTHVAVPIDPTPEMVAEALWAYEHLPAPSATGDGGDHENLKKKFVETVVQAALIAGSQQ